MAADTAPSGPQPVFVGDVQGCADELGELVDRIEDRFGTDYHLHVVGDLINRGPANLPALERVRALTEAGRCTYILGNHEINLLRVGFGLRAASERDTLNEVLESAEADDWLDWVRRRPVLTTGEVVGRPYAMVHAALHPERALATQVGYAHRIEARLGGVSRDTAIALLAESSEGTDAEEASPDPDRDWLGRFTRCRSVLGAAWSSAEPDGDYEPWHVAWRRGHFAYGVVYGHWAIQGLHIVQDLRGLDSGCVHHGRGHDGFLTAWLPGLDGRSGDPFRVPDDAFWQVAARRRYYLY